MRSSGCLVVCLDEHTQRPLSRRCLNKQGNFGGGSASVFHGNRNHRQFVRVIQERPLVNGFYAKFRQATIAVDPVVEKPLKVTLATLFQQALKVWRAGVSTGAISSESVQPSM